MKILSPNQSEQQHDQESSPTKRMIFLLNNAKFLLSHRLEFASAVRDGGYEVHIICACKEIKTIDFLTSEGFYFHPLSVTRSGLNPFRELLVFIEIYQLFRKVKPDIAYMVSIKAVIYGGLVARITKVKSIMVTISGLGYVFINKHFKARVLQKIALFFYRIVFRHQNIRVIFQNPDDMRYFLSIPVIAKSKALLIKGVGVNLTEFAPSPHELEGPIRVTMVARLLRDKGVYEFIEAAQILHSKKCNIIMQLVGDIDPQNPASLTRTQIEKMVAEGVVVWNGHSNEIANIYRNSHIACLPSYREGLPKSLMEALACGLPIITTDVPGCREIIVNGSNGILVPAKDGNAISEAILKLANQPILRKEMGRASRVIAENEYNVHKITAEILDVVNQLAAGNHVKV